MAKSALVRPSDNRSHFIIWNLVTGHATSRIKTGFKELERKRMEQGLHVVDVPKVKRGTSAMMTPWDRRAESRSVDILLLIYLVLLGRFLVLYWWNHCSCSFVSGRYRVQLSITVCRVLNLFLKNIYE